MFGRLTPIVKNLLLINIGIYALQAFLGLPLEQWFGLRYVFAETFQPFQVITYMFIHAGFWHLLGNMFALFIFGPMLEMTFGPKRFLIFYLVTGIGAGFLYGIVDFIEMYQMETAISAFVTNPSPMQLLDFVYAHAGQLTQEGYEFVQDVYPGNPDNPMYIDRAEGIMNSIYSRSANLPMVGASGAVFGILMGFGLLFPNVKLFLLFPPIPIKAKYLVTFYGLYEIYHTMQNSPGDNVAHLAHIGGMIFAFILIKYWKVRSPYG